LSFSKDSLGPNKEWARRVKKNENGEIGNVKAIDIDHLLRKYGILNVSILKIDIEGAEEVVFNSDISGWINKVDTLVIEIHGNRARSVFSQAMSKFNFSSYRFGELTICTKNVAI